MITYILRRLISTIPVLILIALFAFVVLRFAPGDPAIMISGEDASQALNASILIEKPAAGEALSINVVPGQEYFFDFNKDNAEQNNGLTAYTHHNLKNLTIKNFNGDTSVIKLLLEHTPHLEFLEIYDCVGLADLPEITLNKLKILKLFYSDDIQSIENLTVPNIELFKVLSCDNFGYDAMVTASHWKTLKFLWLEHISRALETYPETIADLNLDTFFIDGFL